MGGHRFAAVEAVALNEEGELEALLKDAGLRGSESWWQPRRWTGEVMATREGGLSREQPDSGMLCNPTA